MISEVQNITERLELKDLNLQEFRKIERIGDAVLRLCVCQHFYLEGNHAHYIGHTITRLQTNAYMNRVAEKMGIEFHPDDKSIATRYANALEYKIGRLYMDEGIAAARDFVYEYIKVFKEEI